MKLIPTILCAGFTRYVPLVCGCRLEVRRFHCDRVVREGEPGGGNRREGQCPLCAAQQRLERKKWDREMYRHSRHASSLKPLANPFDAVKQDAEP